MPRIYIICQIRIDTINTTLKLCQSRSRTNERSFIQSTKQIHGKVVKIDLDYCWFQRDYYRFKNNFFSNCIPELAILLKHQGSIYLPLDVDIFIGVASSKKKIEESYTLSLLGKKQL